MFDEDGMRRTPNNGMPLESELGHLAMQFRSARDEEERAAVAERYGQIVGELIRGGNWEEMPAFEDMLPNRWMPEAFFKHWSIPAPGPEREPLAFKVHYPLFSFRE